jgi:hypothetical protein
MPDIPGLAQSAALRSLSIPAVRDVGLRPAPASVGGKERSDSRKTVPAGIERTIGSVSRFRLFEVGEVHVAPGVAGKDQLESW